MPWALSLPGFGAHVGFVDLGALKGNIDGQNYKLGCDLDLAKYRAVSIWCKRFSVNFGAAAPRPTQTSQNRKGDSRHVNREPVASRFVTSRHEGSRFKAPLDRRQMAFEHLKQTSSQGSFSCLMRAADKIEFVSAITTIALVRCTNLVIEIRHVGSPNAESVSNGRCTVRLIAAIAAFYLLMPGTPAALAHHGNSAYDEKNPITLKGTVTEFDFVKSAQSNISGREGRQRERGALGHREPEPRNYGEERLDAPYAETWR